MCIRDRYCFVAPRRKYVPPEPSSANIGLRLSWRPLCASRMACLRTGAQTDDVPRISKDARPCGLPFAPRRLRNEDTTQNNAALSSASVSGHVFASSAPRKKMRWQSVGIFSLAHSLSLTSLIVHHGLTVRCTLVPFVNLTLSLNIVMRHARTSFNERPRNHSFARQKLAW